jgi:transcriptional regulator with XRE-family HTH domain
MSGCQELAARAELQRIHVGFVKRGERSPSLEVLVRLGQALGVPVLRLAAEAEVLSAERKDLCPA